MYTPGIGIDFGTTKTLVAYSLSQGNRPEIAHLGRERNNLPTSAFISESGIWEFGDDADDYACDAALADRYISGFKLKLGSTTPALQVFGEQGFQAYSAQRISSFFFAHVREKCIKEVFNGRSVSRAVITHPVKFSPAQLHDLRNAAEQAGFSDVTLMREPEAAGLAFCRLCPQDLFSGTALIVDWGGGTLDLALVSRKTDAVQIHNNYVAGHNHIGGNEFDELLWKYVNARLQHEKGVKLSDDSVDFQRLQKKKVRAAKEKLSRTDSAMLSLSGKQGAYPTLKLTREELETVLKAAVQSGVDLICHLLHSIQESSLKPSQILLIGGSSQIPLISRLIEESTQIPCRRWQYSHEAVALGAALGKSRIQTDGKPTDNKMSQPSAPASVNKEEEVQSTGPDNTHYSQRLIHAAAVAPVAQASLEVQRLISAAISGDSEAQYKLALCYAWGDGVEKNVEEAKRWCILAVNTGHPGAKNLLAQLYESREEAYQSGDENVPEAARVRTQPSQAQKEVCGSPLPERSIFIALTENERRDGTRKCIQFHNDYLTVNIPCGIAVGEQLRLSSAATGLPENIRITIEDAPLVELSLSVDEWAYGGTKFIHYHGFSRAIEVPKEQPLDRISVYDIPNIGSVQVRLVLSEDPKTAQARKLLQDATTYFKAGKYKPAFTLFLQAAQLGDVEAQYRVACRYAYEQGVALNIDEALRWSLKAAQAGHQKAKTLYQALKINSLHHKKISADDTYDERYLHELMAQAAKLYEQGAAEAAFLVWQKAALKGSAEAQYYLACCYETGDGVSPDLVEAEKWCRVAAQKRYEPALQLFYSRFQSNPVTPPPLPTERRKQEAAQTATKSQTDTNRKKKSSRRDNMENTLQLAGDLYKAGNYEAAFIQWLQAALSGSEEAQYWAACCYLAGKGVDKSFSEAEKWCRASAQSGYAPALELFNQRFKNPSWWDRLLVSLDFQ